MEQWEYELKILELKVLLKQLKKTKQTKQEIEEQLINYVKTLNNITMDDKNNVE